MPAVCANHTEMVSRKVRCCVPCCSMHKGFAVAGGAVSSTAHLILLLPFGVVNVTRLPLMTIARDACFVEWRDSYAAMRW